MSGSLIIAGKANVLRYTLYFICLAEFELCGSKGQTYAFCSMVSLVLTVEKKSLALSSWLKCICLSA